VKTHEVIVHGVAFNVKAPSKKKAQEKAELNYSAVLSIRKEIETNVTGHNRMLKDRVRLMTLVQLLRNVHPLDRDNYAARLRARGVIYLEEFSKTI